MSEPRTGSRAEILRRVDAALADRAPAGPVPRAYHRDRDPTGGAGGVVDLAAHRIADYRATVHRATEADLVATLGWMLAGRGVRTMVSPQGLPAEWRVPGVTWLVDEPALSVAALDGADGVLTGCALVIAETGTIVLDAGPDQGRRALTLLPDYHLCVVRTTRVVGTVPAALALLSPDRPITFVSGPSATSDIEFDRVEGVHGPRTLDVLFVG